MATNTSMMASLTATLKFFKLNSSQKLCWIEQNFDKK